MEYISLSELNQEVAELIRESFTDYYWLIAEISDVRETASGHCYLEFLEKNPQTNALIARARGTVWNNTFRMLKPYFEQATQQTFTSGIKVLVKVSVDFHELYGYSLTVVDIDPTYTLGDIQQQRQQILKQLEDEGVLSLNKELEFPLLPQRIAIITSQGAAGYEDFLNQLQNNQEGFVFYPHIFPAIMQGEKAENSIIAALDEIYANSDLFDVVVIIRGGGSTSDMHCFDSYLLASNCAQFPLPIITGIGHERDATVLDFVACQRAKTPTAVASLLIDSLRYAFDALLLTQQEITSSSEGIINRYDKELQANFLKLSATVSTLLGKYETSLSIYQMNLKEKVKSYFSQKEHQIAVMEQFVQLSSPQHVLSKGYSITLKDGKVIKSKDSLQTGDILETRLKDGVIKSRFL